MNFISHNNILCGFQYGFRKARSTQQAIITLVDKITKPQDIRYMYFSDQPFNKFGDDQCH